MSLMMLELGVYPLRFTLKMRRLGYLHHLLTRADDSLARQVLIQQMKNPVKGDWTTTVQNDLKDFDINLSLNDISLLSKKIFKNIVKKACIQSALKYLVEQISKLSKGSEISYTNLSIQNYLQPGHNLTVSEMRTICMIRLRNLNLKCNFPSIHADRKCIAPQCSEDDSQFHIYSCLYLEDKDAVALKNTSYYDIFTNNVGRQRQVMQIVMKHYMTRQTILSSQTRNDGPADPVMGNIAGIRGGRN